VVPVRALSLARGSRHSDAPAQERRARENKNYIWSSLSPSLSFLTFVVSLSPSLPFFVFHSLAVSFSPSLRLSISLSLRLSLFPSYLTVSLSLCLSLFDHPLFSLPFIACSFSGPKCFQALGPTPEPATESHVVKKGPQ